MRLICGIVRFDSAPLAPSMLPSMCAAMVAPGLRPVQQLWRGASAGLAVLDFAEGDPRLERRVSGSVLACDARLDDTTPTSPQTSQQTSQQTSAQTLCAVTLDKRGPGELCKLLGDYALADWNTRTQELTLARDRAGVRPLVFHHKPGELVAFASFPRALHALGFPSRQIDRASVVREMLGVSRRSETLFADVEAVRPGFAITFSRSRVRSHRPANDVGNPSLHTTPQEGAEALREAITAAVRSRTVSSNGAVATHLSGGLDSSAISVLAARALAAQGRRLLSYSLLGHAAEKPQPGSEQAYIQAVLDQEPTIDWTPVPSGDPLRSQVKYDRVLSDADDDPENAICAHASARGASLMLSGWGGDEGATFNGRGALAHALLHGQLPYVFRELMRMRRNRGLRTGSIVRGEVLHFFRADIHRSSPSLSRLASLVKPGVLKQALAAAVPLPVLGSNVLRNQQQLITGRHLELRTTNWAEIGARYGLAFSFPLLDRRVVECATSMHATWHLRDGWKRRPFRDSMEGILPECIRWRHDKRTPYPEAQVRLASKREDLHEEIDRLCERPEIQEIFELQKVRALRDDFPSLSSLLVDPASAGSIFPLAQWLAYSRFLTRSNQRESLL